MTLEPGVITRHRFTVDDFHRMAEVGIFGPELRVELIEGEIIDMAPIGRRDQSCVDRLAALFFDALPEEGAIVRVRGFVRLSGISKPWPDIALLRPDPDFYAEREAGPADVLLLVEVSDTSVPYDREVKVPLYASCGIPEVWIVDLRARRVLVYRGIGSGRYQDVFEASAGQQLRALALPELVLDVDRILGRGL